MKLIIAGTRNLKNVDLDSINSFIKGFNLNPDEIVSGHSGIIDKLGEAWAKELDVPLKIFKADWVHCGKAAGPIRNDRMGHYADELLLIWDGKSLGSANMKYTMKTLKKPIYEVTHFEIIP